MFLSLSKTLAKFGGLRLGFGIRLKKSNTIWMLCIMSFVYMLQAMWYIMVCMFWMVYAVIYGMIWCYKKMFQIGKNAYIENKKEGNQD